MVLRLDPIDLQNKRFMDLTVPGTQEVVRRAIEEGWVDYVHFGTPCTVFLLGPVET